jgi:hypothetical protein
MLLQNLLRSRNISAKINLKAKGNYELTNSMELSPSWEANIHSSSQESPHLSWNLKVHYGVDKSLPLAPILSHRHPVHTFSPYFPKIHSYIVLPSTSRPSAWSVPFTFCDQNCVHISHVPCMPCALPILSSSEELWTEPTFVLNEII